MRSWFANDLISSPGYVGTSQP